MLHCTVQNGFTIVPAAATEFLQQMMTLANPENLPDDEDGDKIADKGTRVKNMKKGSQACTKLLKGKVHRCAGAGPGVLRFTGEATKEVASKTLDQEPVVKPAEDSVTER